MLHPVPTLKESPSQTAGPYVHIGLTPNFCDLPGVYGRDIGSKMINGDVEGERITVSVRLIDGAGVPLADGLVEIWQADASGSYVASVQDDSNSAPAFNGWGRQAADDSGVATFDTIKPGRVIGPDGRSMAPHISLWIVARGINTGLQTRLYFDDEAQANETDFVLNKILDKRRRETLIAHKQGDERYHLDINLQGECETVFFDF